MLDQTAILRMKKDECALRNSTESPRLYGLKCPRVWDGVLCWPQVDAGIIFRMPCPDYVAGFVKDGYASRNCTSEGTWFYREDKNSTWTNYSECIPKYIKPLPGFDSTYYSSDLLHSYIPIINHLSRIGYSISLSALIIAFTILAVVKKLRCPRNNLHMHLFASFILRAFMALLRSNLFISGIALSSQIINVNGDIVSIREHDGLECKLVTSLWQYFMMANYCWILMEGLYLHNLIFLALFSDNSGICLYVVLGWGIPVIFVVPWVAVRLAFENTLCWTMNSNSFIFWIIRGPITVSIIINFIFFINISRILFIKLKSSHSQDIHNARYRKLAKSTLVLVPLFGVHYMVFLAMSASAGIDDVTEIVWLFCDQFFASFQGFFVAVLYCFMNGEVQGELRKKWQYWSQDRRPSFFTHSVTIFSKSRNSTTSAGDQKEQRRKSSGRSPTIPNADCNTHTSYYSNHSNTASPRLEHPPDNFNWSYYPGRSENNLNCFLDKSPASEEKLGNKFDFLFPPETVEPPMLTPIVNGKATRPSGFSPTEEKLEVLYMERMENVNHNESSV